VVGSSKPPTFKELFKKESELLAKADRRAADIGKTKTQSPTPTADEKVSDQSTKTESKPGPTTESPGPAGEPWINYTPTDRVGLAFSGGGIRSATFNLGVLKALNELKILKHVDYLSTVSGGGYIGAWWSAWRARNGSRFRFFPDPPLDTISCKKAENREPEEVRHLREFSNFLSPRIGFFQTEMWNAVMAVLSAMLPAIIVASSVIALALLTWLGMISLLPPDSSQISMATPGWILWVLSLLGDFSCLQRLDLLQPFVILVVLFAVHCIGESQWRQFGKAEQLSWKKRNDVLFRVTMMAAVSLGVILGWNWLSHCTWIQARRAITPSWDWVVGILRGNRFTFVPHLFTAPILLIGLALILLVPRLILMRFSRGRATSFVNAMDRGLSRLLGTALVSGALAILWLTGCWLNASNWGTKAPGGALISGGAFALLRNWISRLGPAKKGGIMDVLKPLLPQILAYIAIILWMVCIAALLASGIKADVFGFHSTLKTFWLLCACALIVILFAIVFFDPAQVSMHSFYRTRLCRAYLGASNPDADKSSEKNRQTDLRLRDDVELRNLSPEGKEKPIHLVCCTANDLAGDHLENLSRGSRSAVLSRFGFSIGDCWHDWEEPPVRGKKGPTLGLASAITASAAAFNSNMGSLSMTLGAGVTFLCTALNLRLGLWLVHPLWPSKNRGASKLIPGWLFLKEMFGLTYSGLQPQCNPAKPVKKYVHLSDGGHFENLALYELVRRHCRYIIVSDCGADPQVAFDDFGNAVRRIREDFGVEIDIDLSPLRPSEARISKQHLAVGTVTYDPRGAKKDIGILVYLKPTLTGDESCDIAQYRTRNQAFPHESTGDQFYDEAQWESYRRLGEHAAHSAWRFVERLRPGDELSADEIFNGARWEWYQSPPQLQEKFVEFTARFTSLEGELRDKAPKQFVREMFPELQFIDKKGVLKKPMTSGEMASTLHFLLQIIQLMEDAWVGCSLETHWNDPHNLGWMNAFQRWAYTPSFRLWWPILKPMYGAKFRRFMEERLSLADEDYPPTTATVNKHGQTMPDGVAKIYWERMHERDSNREEGKTVYTFDLTLTFQQQPRQHKRLRVFQHLPKNARKNQEYDVQAGLAFVVLPEGPVPSERTDRVASWTNEEFFIPPSLWGAGLGARFLNNRPNPADPNDHSRGLLQVLKEDEKIQRCVVTIEEADAKAKTRSTSANEKPDVKWLKRTDLASRQQRADLLAFYQRAGFTLEADGTLVRDLKDI
jgi:hypothetical protein